MSVEFYIFPRYTFSLFHLEGNKHFVTEYFQGTVKYQFFNKIFYCNDLFKVKYAGTGNIFQGLSGHG